MKIKVCGITSVKQLSELEQLGIDYAGMIFYEGSKRYAGSLLAGQQEAIQKIPIRKVGVFVNALYDEVLKKVDEFGLWAVQLHGDETDEYCMELKGRTKLIKAIRVAGEEDVSSGVALFENACDYFLFDTQTEAYGGSGRQFDWSFLQNANIQKPFFLSGGIGLEDVDKLRSLRHPLLHAVDVNSRFETSPGIKDTTSIAQFQKNLQHG
jgi:phosphoribosylanthranilate isomerase